MTTTTAEKRHSIIICALVGCAKVANKIQAVPCFAMIGTPKQRCNEWFCTEAHQFEHVLIHKDD